jgi:signal transduction histidine kinase
MITAPILATSVLLLVLGIGSAWYVHRLNRDVSYLLDQHLECAVASQRLTMSLYDVRSKVDQFLGGSGGEKALPGVLEMGQRALGHLRRVEETAKADEIRVLVDQVRRGYVSFHREFDAVGGEMAPDDRRQKVRQLHQLITREVLVPAQELLETAQRAARHHTARNRSAADSVGLGLLMLGVCGAVGGLMAGYGIAEGIARRIEQSEREATRSEQLAAVGQLAAGLGHELRNPLTAMRVLVEAGRDPSAGSGLDQRDLQVLDEEISRLEKLVESFLDFARPPRLEKATIDARSLVEQTLHLVGGPARQLGVTIDWQPPAEALTVEADPVQMRQVLLNLLLNGMEAAGAGGKIMVELDGRSRVLSESSGRRADPSFASSDRHLPVCRGSWCSLIHVSDSGPGVPEEMKEKIFEPFVSTKETGMGLGLAVSRRIVEAHGGTVTAADNPGGGARFTIWLPVGNGDPTGRLGSPDDRR